MGTRNQEEPSRNRVGTENGIESPIARTKFRRYCRIYISSSTCSLSPFLREIFLQEKSFPARNQLRGGNQFLLSNQCLGIDYEISVLLSIEEFLKSYRPLHWLGIIAQYYKWIHTGFFKGRTFIINNNKKTQDLTIFQSYTYQLSQDFLKVKHSIKSRLLKVQTLILLKPLALLFSFFLLSFSRKTHQIVICNASYAAGHAQVYKNRAELGQHHPHTQSWTHIPLSVEKSDVRVNLLISGSTLNFPFEKC